MKILTYLYSHEWILNLAQCDFDITMLVTTHGPVWNHSDYEFPKRTQFCEKLNSNLYHASLAPVGDIVNKGVPLEMANTFIQVEIARGLPCLLVDFPDENQTDIAAQKASDLVRRLRLYPKLIRGDVTPKQLEGIARTVAVQPKIAREMKTRWTYAGHPAWQRHAAMILEYLGGDNCEGTVIEVDCGDGAMIGHLHSRLAKCKVIGVCKYKQEKMVAEHCDPALNVIVGDDDTVRQKEPDYIVISDGYPEEIPRYIDLMRTARKGGVLTINKHDQELPPPWELQETFKGWDVYETLGHYCVVRK